MTDKKFRLWDGNKMHYPQPSHSSFHGPWFFTLTGDNYQNGVHQDVVMLQYLGFYDKDETEICEGDIVEYEVFSHCEYSDDDDPEKDIFYYNIVRDVVKMRLPRFWLKKEQFGYEGENLVSPDKTKIVGNIYENPKELEVPIRQISK